MKKPNLIESKFKSLLFIEVIGWLVLLIGQVIDNILAGQFLSEEGLSAVQVIAPFATFISAVGSFSSMGFAIKFSRLKGQGKDDEANKSVGLGIKGLGLGTFISICCGIIIVVMHFFTKKNSIKIKLNLNLKNIKDPAKFGFPALLGNISIAIVI